MARLGISDLPLPVRESDPEFAPYDSTTRKRFETTTDVLAEEAERVKLLRRQHHKRSDLLHNEEVGTLCRRIARNRPPTTLASARHMHDLRRRIVGALWKLVRDGQ